jgi:short-subunit dehydrogenase
MNCGLLFLLFRLTNLGFVGSELVVKSRRCHSRLSLCGGHHDDCPLFNAELRTTTSQQIQINYINIMTNNIKYTAIVTGASRGIGKGIAIALAKSNVVTDLALTARKEENLNEVAEEIAKVNKNVRIIKIGAELNDPKSTEKIINETIQAFGQLNLLVNNAGYGGPKRTANLTYGTNYYDSELVKTFQVNLFAVVQLSTYAIPHLRKTKGVIINISSGLSALTVTGYGVYGSAKAALNHFTACVAKEEPEILVLSIAPGLVETDMYSESQQGHDQVDDADKQLFQNLIDSGNFHNPTDVGAKIAVVALKAPKDWSGKYIHDVNIDEEVAKLIK